MDNYQKFFLFYNIKLELFSIFVLSPLGLYFVVFAGGYIAKNLYVLLIGATIVLTISIIIAILIRKYKLFSILIKMKDPPDGIDYKEIKKSLNVLMC